MPQISRVSYKPIYLQICDLIREKIDSGEIVIGSRIWSESDIIEKFNVSRNTARKALETLQNEGIVSRIQGKGSFVSQPKVDYGLQYLMSFSEEIHQKRLEPTSKVICFTREHPEPFHAANLKIPEDQWVLKLERVRYADQSPIAYQLTFIPENLCPGLLDYNFAQQSLYAVFEQEYNHVLSWQKTVVKPVVADPFIAETLRVSPQTPLLYTESITYLAGGTPIESNKNIYLSERYQFTVLSNRLDPTRSIEEK